MNLSKNFIRQLSSNLAVFFFRNMGRQYIFQQNSNFQLSDGKVLHETRKNSKRGGVCVFVHESLTFKLREDLSINCDAIQSLSIEISSTKSTGHLMVI